MVCFFYRYVFGLRVYGVFFVCARRVGYGDSFFRFFLRSAF